MSLSRRIGIGLPVLVAIGIFAPDGRYVLGAIGIAVVVVSYGFWIRAEEHHSSRRTDSRPFRAGRHPRGRVRTWGRPRVPQEAEPVNAARETVVRSRRRVPYSVNAVFTRAT
ncbi:hypothetical protein ACGFZH_18335 [Streptomyces zaomyceticus]|uniref:hypothetical protein n=1 Tax=Streptomyces zaomyceticus TaxID=68286 RepID=UPI003721D824